MKLDFLMIILSLLDDGRMSAAFVNTETLQECERRAGVVRSILEKGKYPVEQMVCRAAEVEFEPFVHGEEPDAERQAYLISFDDEKAAVEAVESCGGVDAKPGRYCAVSTQKIVANGN